MIRLSFSLFVVLMLMFGIGYYTYQTRPLWAEYQIVQYCYGTKYVFPGVYVHLKQNGETIVKLSDQDGTVFFNNLNENEYLMYLFYIDKKDISSLETFSVQPVYAERRKKEIKVIDCYLFDTGDTE